MKLYLLLKKPYGEFKNYSPGHMFMVEIKSLAVNADDPNIGQLNLDDEDLENFKLIGEVGDIDEQ